MSKKLYLLVVLMLVVPVILTACGGSDKKDNKTADLKQTFTSTTGITIKYPEGWVARDGSSGVEIGNSQAAIDAMDTTQKDQEIPTNVTGVLISPPMSLEMINMVGKPVKDIMSMMAQSLSSDGTMKIGAVQDAKIGGKDAARFSMTDDKTKSEGFYMGYMIDDKNVLLFAIVARQGELSKFEGTALKIVESLTYTAPAAPVEPTPEATSAG